MAAKSGDAKSVKTVFVGIGIFIVLILAFFYGVQAFYPYPEYQNFCNETAYYPQYTENCTYSQALNDEKQKCSNEQGNPIMEYNAQGCEIAVKQCDYCNREYTNADKLHTRGVFIIALIVGLLALIVGAFLFSLLAVGLSLMAGGLIILLYGTIANWQNFSSMIKFILLLVVLVVLIVLAYKIAFGKLSLRKKKR